MVLIPVVLFGPYCRSRVQDGVCTRWHVYKMACVQDGMCTRWHVYKMAL